MKRRYIYNKEPPSCVHYLIKWKVILNKRLITKDTEQDLVLAPSQYWSLCLRPKLEEVLSKKLPPNRRVKVVNTNVVIISQGKPIRYGTRHRRSPTLISA